MKKFLRKIILLSWAFCLSLSVISYAEAPTGSIPTSLIFMWEGTNGSIPANWIRETALDTYFIHAAIGDTAGTAGGNANHTHTAVSHTHNFTAGAGVGGVTHDGSTITPKTGTANTTHGHNSLASSSATVTLQTTTNDPSYFDIIAIKPNDVNRVGVPALAWALWDSTASAPTSWSVDTAPDEKLLKGSAVGGDGGGTGGVTSHGHTEDAHSHTAKNSNASNSNTNYTTGGTDMASSTHIHSVSLDSNTETVGSTSDLPTYQKFACIQNDSGGEDLPLGIVGFYLGAKNVIPDGWVQVILTDGYDMIMAEQTLASIGTTGGTRQHTHTATAHSHGSTAGTANTLRGVLALGVANFSSASHTHTWTINNGTSAINDSDTRASYPSYKEVILLKYVGLYTQMISIQLSSISSLFAIGMLGFTRRI